MKFIALPLLCFAIATGFAAETRVADTNDVQVWLTNAFRPWLTRAYPEIYSSFYPEWFHDHPAGLLPGPFIAWLAEAFPDLETERFPTWLDDPSEDKLGTTIPAWWSSVKKGKYSVSPLARPIARITRGPYLQLGTTNSMVVRWRTDTQTTSTVFYGSSPARLNRSVRSHGLLTEHAVQLTNLAPA